jgi:DNA-binding NtrC family response regulator
VLSSGPVIGSDLLPGHITGRSFQDACSSTTPTPRSSTSSKTSSAASSSRSWSAATGNQTDAAEQFRIPLSTLNQKIKRLNIEIRKKGREYADIVAHYSEAKPPLARKNIVP